MRHDGPATIRLHFVRDGSGVGIEDHCIGQTDVRLSAAGRRQCRRLVRQMPALTTRFISSDLQRAYASAEILTASPILAEPRLREMYFGDWEGRRWADIALPPSGDSVAWSEEWPSIRAPGGESFVDVVTRVEAWLESLPRDGSDYLVVAHAGSIRAAAVSLLGISPSRAFDLVLDHASVSTFELSHRGASLIRWNSPGL